MGKIRIYELAKELRQDSKTIITELKKMDVAASNHMSTIDQADADKIRTHFANGSKPAEEKRQPKNSRPSRTNSSWHRSRKNLLNRSVTRAKKDHATTASVKM